MQKGETRFRLDHHQVIENNLSTPLNVCKVSAGLSHTGFSVTALKQWKAIEDKVPKATINDRIFCTVYCTEHRKWNVKRVFHFIGCKVDLCAPYGIHYRTRNGGLHFKVWKSQGRSFNEKSQETQELIIGQDDGESGTFKTGSKDISSCLEDWPLWLIQPSPQGSLQICAGGALSHQKQQSQHVPQTLPDFSRSNVHAKESEVNVKMNTESS